MPSRRPAAIAKELGARKVLPLAVGGAFHTPFMAPAAERLAAALSATTFADAEVPVVANVDALPHQHADQWAGLLDAQLTSPVQWRQSVERMVADGVTAFLELGPGSVLTGMAKRSAPDAVAKAAAEPAALDAVVEVAASVGAVEHHDGEHLFAVERLVVSPAAGVFTPAGGRRRGPAHRARPSRGARGWSRGALTVPRHGEGAARGRRRAPHPQPAHRVAAHRVTAS